MYRLISIIVFFSYLVSCRGGPLIKAEAEQKSLSPLESYLKLENGKAGLVDGIEGRKSLELINALYESIETRKEIALRFKPEMCKLGVV